MFPKSTSTKNGTFGSQTTQSKVFSTTNNTLNESSEITPQTMTTESQPLNSNASIDGNVPPEFNEINEANCFSKSFIIGDAKEKLFPENSLLSNSCHSYLDEIFIDKNREMLNSLPLNSEFNVPIGGRKSFFDNSASSFIDRYTESSSDSSEENADGFSVTSLKTSTKSVPTTKPENQNEFYFKNPVLAKFFEFFELSPISSQLTNRNVLVKLFPSNSLTKSNLKKSTSDDSFEINDQSMIDFECPSSNFSESFKSTSSKPHNLDNY
uniref:Uncharacterized protein n=2 Tax=Panagrolaimus sp. PS1159 TaxID=55785 RepID=A0AC35FHX6_9BILA